MTNKEQELLDKMEEYIELNETITKNRDHAHYKGTVLSALQSEISQLKSDVEKEQKYISEFDIENYRNGIVNELSYRECKDRLCELMSEHVQLKNEWFELKFPDIKEQSIKHPEITDELKEAMEVLKESNKVTWSKRLITVFEFAQQMYDYWEYIGSLPLDLEEQSQRMSAEEIKETVSNIIHSCNRYQRDTGEWGFDNEEAINLICKFLHDFASQGQDEDKLSYQELETAILKFKAKSEYKQAAIIIIRGIFSKITSNEKQR